MNLPGAWNDTTMRGEKPGGAGYGTFRLRILPGTLQHEPALRLVELNSAYKLWANGRLIAENGVVGTDASRETPGQSVRIPRLPVAV
jgi:hypothetical protein